MSLKQIDQKTLHLLIKGIFIIIITIIIVIIVITTYYFHFYL